MQPPIPELTKNVDRVYHSAMTMLKTKASSVQRKGGYGPNTDMTDKQTTNNLVHKLQKFNGW